MNAGDLGEKPKELCPLVGFQQVVGGKYKLRILWELTKGPRRYGELRRSLTDATLGKPVTPRVLSRELRDLETRGLLHRKQYPVVPPKVEYRLSETGETLVPVMQGILKWWVGGGKASLPRRLREIA
jgi:DNA-binding HxlR family transcriptional regulator